jgi:iron complex outermembrane receptor protein
LTGLAADGRLDWAAGIYMYEADDSNQGWNFLYPFILSTNNHKDVQTTENSAIFVHGTYDLTERLSITAGVRQTDDEKIVNVFRQNFVDGSIVIPNTQVAVKASETSPKIGLSWQINEDLMTYVQWATGFRGGGFGPRPANPLQVAAFDVETLETLEGGVKTYLADGRIRLNASVFFSTYKDQQQGTQEFDSSGAIWFRTVNTGESEYQGVELELLVNPTDSFQLETSLGYNEFDRVDPGRSGLCRYDANGDLCPAPRTPEWNAAIGATYFWNLSNGSQMMLRGDTTYQSKMSFNTDPVFGFQDDLTLVNARLTWVSPGEEWSVALFGTNLTDEEYFHGKLSLVTVLGREQGNIAAPRQMGLSIKREF